MKASDWFSLIALFISIGSIAIAVVARIEVERYQGAFWKLTFAMPPKDWASQLPHLTLTNVGKSRARNVRVKFKLDPTFLLIKPVRPLPWELMEPDESEILVLDSRLIQEGESIRFSLEVANDAKRRIAVVKWTTVLGFRRCQRVVIPPVPHAFLERPAL